MKFDDIKHSNETTKVQPMQHQYDPMVNQSNSDVDQMLLNLVQGRDTQIIEVLNTGDTNNNYTSDAPKSLIECISTYDQNDGTVFSHLTSNISETDCEEINRLTEGQSDDSEWFRYREGRITSSVMHNACRYKGNDPENYIVKQIFNECTVSTPALTYGKEREHVARNLYEIEYGKKHKGGHVKLSGLIVNKDMPHLGASPDGIVHCKCCGTGLLEIKCPYKFKNSTLDEICNDNNYHILKDENGCMKLKTNSSWYTQIQSQMAISRTKWCDFVVYLEQDIKSGKHKIYTERIVFDEQLWDDLYVKSKEFFEKFVLVRLLADK